jgi:hypothetical protein
MGQDTLQSLSPEALKATILIAAALGVAVWFFGARFSRSIIPLCLFSIGGLVGLHLPEWYGWSIQGWATALGAALVLGLWGYLMHRLWIGVGLGALLAMWSCVAFCIAIMGDQRWNLPDYTSSIPPQEYLRVLWMTLPQQIARPLACGSAAAMLAGLFASWHWPRLTLVFLYSMIGATLLAIAAVIASQFQPAWVKFLPKMMSQRLGLLAAVVICGATLQWWLLPSGKTEAKTKKKKAKPKAVAAKQ